MASLILLGVHSKPAWMSGVARTMAMAAGLGAAAIAVLPHTGGLCQNILRRLPLPPALRDRLIGLAGQVLLGMRRSTTRADSGFAAFTVVIWVSDAVGTMAGAHALGLTLSFPMAILLLTGLGLGSALPSTPGYVGIYQFVAVTVLAPLGISKSGALAFILMMQAYGYATTLLLGLPCMYILRSNGPPGGGSGAVSVSPIPESAVSRFHGLHVTERDLTETSQQAFLGNRPDLVGHRYHGPAGALHRDQERWARRRRRRQGNTTTVRRRSFTTWSTRSGTAASWRSRSPTWDPVAPTRPHLAGASVHDSAMSAEIRSNSCSMA